MGSIGSLLDVARRAMNVHSQAIRTIGDNISNVNTPGYSRRRAELVTTQATGTENLQSGTGVAVQDIVRQVDQYLNTRYQTNIGNRAFDDIREQLLARAEQPFSLEADPGHIGTALSNFFSSLDDLANNPSDLSLRTQIIQSGQTLTTAISTTYNNLATLQREADDRLVDAVDQVNSYSTQIAEINQQIARGETDTQQNLTLRDQRDEIMRKLSELVPVSTIEQSDGTILVSLSNGFGLVKGSTSQALSATNAPSFGTYPPGLDGAALHFVTFDYNPSGAPSDSNLTNVLASGTGEIGALLRFRGTQGATDTSPFNAQGDVVEFASRIEALSRWLLTDVNDTYTGVLRTPRNAPTNTGTQVDENTATATVYDPSSGSLNDITSGTYTPTGVYGLFSFRGTASDANTDGLANDLASNLASNNIANFASRLQFNVSNPRDFKAALDLNTTGGALTFSTGDVQNAQNLAALRNQQIDWSRFSVGSFASTSTAEELYKQTVSYIGAVHSQVQSNLQTSKAQEDQTKQLYDSVSGVNLDEEFANLVNFQRGFQANARLVKTADDLLSTVIGLLG